MGEGHPDKVADQISDAILDACLDQDPKSRVACETLVKDKTVVVAGEITTKAEFCFKEVISQTLRGAGYNYEPTIINLISKQLPQMQRALDLGANDQGVMFGFASNSTPNLMPLASQLSRELCWMLRDLRTRGSNIYHLGSDCKTQVTLKTFYDGGKEDIKISKVVLSCVHGEDIAFSQFQGWLVAQSKAWLDSKGYKWLLRDGYDIEWMVNLSGPWTIGGPEADCGATGRKIVVDNYGSDCPVGGGCFSGKSPTMTDRTGAYAMRWIAKNLCAALGGVAGGVTTQVSYGIGKPDPCSFRIKLPSSTFGSEQTARELEKRVKEVVDLRPKALVERFGLERMIYLPTSRDGHFGIETYPWEELNLRF